MSQAAARYSAREWTLILGIVVMSGADAVATVLYVRGGGAEANPLMAWSLARGPVAFAALKMGITTAGAACMLLHIRSPRVRRCIQGVFGLYVLLMLYHSWIMATAGR